MGVWRERVTRHVLEGVSVIRTLQIRLAALAEALAVVAVTLSLTQATEVYPFYNPGPLAASPPLITLTLSSAPVAFLAVGALLLCLGVAVDMRLRRGSRVAPLVAILLGAVTCALAVAQVALAGIWLQVGDPASSALAPLAAVYAPATLAAILCAAVAFVPRRAPAAAALSRAQPPRYRRMNVATCWVASRVSGMSIVPVITATLRSTRCACAGDCSGRATLGRCAYEFIMPSRQA